MNRRSLLLALSLALSLGGCASYSSHYRDDIVYRDGSYYSPSRDGYGDYYYAPEPSYDSYYDYGFAPPWGWSGLHCDFYRGYRCSPFGYYGYGYPGWSVGLYYGGGGYYYDPYGYDPYYGGYFPPYGYWPPHRHHHHDDDPPPVAHQPGPTPMPRPVYPGDKPPHPNKPWQGPQLQSLPEVGDADAAGEDGEQLGDPRSDRERFRDDAGAPRMRWRPSASFISMPTPDVSRQGEPARSDDRMILDQDGNPVAVERVPVRRDCDPVGPARDAGAGSGRVSRPDPEPPRIERRPERDDDASDRRRDDDRPRPRPSHE